MRTVNRSAIVPYTPAAMFALVQDVRAYPEFLPWCTAAAIQTSGTTELVASLTIGYGAFNSKFTTRNRFSAPDWILMELVEGPFSSLQGRWGFLPLGDAGCEINFEIAFGFSSSVTDRLLGPAFATICNQLIDAFIRRARELYG